MTELWPESVRHHGTTYAEEALRHALLHEASHPSRTALLLECAEIADLRPLSCDEAAEHAAKATHRAERHALWRYLHRLPEGPALLAATTHATDAYERLLLSPPTRLSAEGWRSGGIVVAQTMLLGDLLTPGAGLSGGLSVLLGGLGDRLARSEGIAGVITVVLTGHDGLARGPGLLRERTTGHWVLSLPVDAPTPPQQNALAEHRAALAWWAARLLGALPRAVDVLHVRYADDGSMALAHAAARSGIRLFFTATPDPHRTVARNYGEADPDDSSAADRLRDDLHRIYCADRLVDRADTVIGIPGSSGSRELLRHFPVLAARYGPAGPASPPEGIAPYSPAPDETARQHRLLAGLFTGGASPDSLAPESRDLPMLLCVGRLHPMKQQDLLVRTWLATDLWRRTTLLIVGGSGDCPTPSEQQMRAELGALVAGHAEAARHLALLPAMPNNEVRRLEHALATPANGVRAWYVCPSVKEEFGIAILEAMEAGLPPAGPLRGGVAHYLRDGLNGLLLDTSSASGLAHGLRRMANLHEDDRLRLARAARATVKARYSVTDMADALAAEYRAVMS
ncbi:glycosyltransferase family 4 protein [Streptomyces sp. NPDC048002]|uniref:glycosyltransferase family 4 protein n=1 Tax=Streptomyces sp. NPDC048002 TaxID=3154344 RepID=UPI0033E10CEA